MEDHGMMLDLRRGGMSDVLDLFIKVSCYLLIYFFHLPFFFHQRYTQVKDSLTLNLVVNCSHARTHPLSCRRVHFTSLWYQGVHKQLIKVHSFRKFPIDQDIG